VYACTGEFVAANSALEEVYGVLRGSYGDVDATIANLQEHSNDRQPLVEILEDTVLSCLGGLAPLRLARLQFNGE